VRPGNLLELWRVTEVCVAAGKIHISQLTYASSPARYKDRRRMFSTNGKASSVQTELKFAACRMLNWAIGENAPPVRITSGHNPLCRFRRWLANLRIFEVEEIKLLPFAPFVKRLIGTIRGEHLDHTASGRPHRR
jgi:hypothetical protein